MGRNHIYSRETRVGAVADYLLGFRLEVIRRKWGLKSCRHIVYWVQQCKHFKLRNKTRLNPHNNHYRR